MDVNSHVAYIKGRVPISCHCYLGLLKTSTEVPMTTVEVAHREGGVFNLPVLTE